MIDSSPFLKYPLKRSSALPLYFQIKHMIKGLIESGELSQGDMIPPEILLCETLTVSRSTLRQALNELVADGLLYRVKGYGTFVSNQKALHKINKEFFSLLLDGGPLDLNPVKANQEVAQQLGLPTASAVYQVDRIDYRDHDPLYYGSLYLSAEFLQKLKPDMMQKEALSGLIKQHLLTKIRRFHHRLEAVQAAKEDVALLKIRNHGAIQVIYSTGYSLLDDPICYSVLRCRGDQNVFTVDQITI